jgi:hypothetical protein
MGVGRVLTAAIRNAAETAPDFRDAVLQSVSAIPIIQIGNFGFRNASRLVPRKPGAISGKTRCELQYYRGGSPSCRRVKAQCSICRYSSRTTRKLTLMGLEKLPAFIREHYEIHEWKHAHAILETDFPEEWADIQAVLTGF